MTTGRRAIPPALRRNTKPKPPTPRPLTRRRWRLPELSRRLLQLEPNRIRFAPLLAGAESHGPGPRTKKTRLSSTQLACHSTKTLETHRLTSRIRRPRKAPGPWTKSHPNTRSKRLTQRRRRKIRSRSRIRQNCKLRRMRDPIQHSTPMTATRRDT